MAKALRNRFSAPSLRRIPYYLQVIQDLQREGKEFVSATVIAEALRLEPVQVRKDLAMSGITGTPKKGFPAQELIGALERFLGWDSVCDAVLVGAGNIGAALLGYQGFLRHGLNIMAAFDVNPQLIGKRIHNITVFNAADMDVQIRNFNVTVAILTIPSDCAQESADILVNAGIEGIWNFTSVKLKVPSNVAVQQEDLSVGYAMLRGRMKNRTPPSA